MADGHITHAKYLSRFRRPAVRRIIWTLGLLSLFLMAIAPSTGLVAASVLLLLASVGAEIPTSRW